MATIDTTFLCGVDQVSLPMTTRRGEQFSDRYFLTRDEGMIASLLPKFGATLGSVETRYLTGRASAVAYRFERIEVEVPSTEQISAALDAQLIVDMLAIKGLESALWMVKDNACHFDRAWIAGTANGKTVVNNNVWATRHSCADGSFQSVVFSSDELRVARNFRRPLGMHLMSEDAPTALAKGSLRFQRFEYFVGAARASIDVAVKIAQYCSGLEALVSTAQQELSHQVSERVAAALVNAGPKRITTYKLVKKAYGFRSKTVHGAPFKPADANQLRDCSKGIDQLCRALQALYFDEDRAFRTAVEGSDENLSEFFLDAILACGPVQDRIEL